MNSVLSTVLIIEVALSLVCVCAVGLGVVVRVQWVSEEGELDVHG